MNVSKDKEKKEQKKIGPKQIAALVCAVLPACLYVGGLILVCMNPADFGHLFAGWLGAVIGLPILIWLLIWSLRQLKKRRDED